MKRIVACVASLIGVPSTRHPDVERALRSGLNLRYLVGVVALRLLRKIVTASDRVRGAARGRRASAGGRDGTNAAAANAASGSSAHGSEGEGFRIPVIEDRSARRAFPRHIFQTWKSKIELPEDYARWSESVKVKNPNFEYFLWDDFDNRRFVADCFPWFLAIYDGYPREIYRADAVRYFFMYQFGGAYLDMDTECLESLASLFDSQADVWLGRMGEDANFPHSIPNAVMASKPRQEFWLLAMHFLVENAAPIGTPRQPLVGPEAMTGPILLKRTYDAYVSGKPDAVREMIRGVARLLPANLQPDPTRSIIELLEPSCWYPLNWANVIDGQLLWELSNSKMRLGDRTKRWLFPNSYLVSYWGHSWKAAR